MRASGFRFPRGFRPITEQNQSMPHAAHDMRGAFVSAGESSAPPTAVETDHRRYVENQILILANHNIPRGRCLHSKAHDALQG